MKKYLIICIMIVFSSCLEEENDQVLSDKHEILSFQFLISDNPLEKNVIANIDGINNEIVAVIEGNQDITALVPTIEISEGATFSPTGAVDFTNPVVYTVVAENGSSREYTVSVLKILSDQKEMLSFEFTLEQNAIPETYVGIIDEEKKEVLIELPIDLDKSDLIPDIQVSEHANFVPEGSRDFNKPVEYKVIAEDGTVAIYSVNVTLSQKDVLIALSRANPGNTLPWDLQDSNLNNFQGVETNAAGDIISLELMNANLTALNDEFTQLTALEFVNLASNKFQQFPSQLLVIEKLVTILLRENELKEMPETISNLINLEVLDVSENKISKLPNEVFELTELRNLFLNNNLIEIIPPEIAALKSLKLLSIDSNLLKKIPNEIGNLTLLERGVFSNNQLEIIPAEFGKLQNLDVLDFNNNNIKQVPKELGLLTGLERLRLLNNLIESIPQEVCDLAILHDVQVETDGVPCD